MSKNKDARGGFTTIQFRRFPVDDGEFSNGFRTKVWADLEADYAIWHRWTATESLRSAQSDDSKGPDGEYLAAKMEWALRKDDALKDASSFRPVFLTEKQFRLTADQYRRYSKSVHEPVDQSAPAASLEPPAGPELLLRLLLTKKSREAASGDLIEQFHLDCRRYGPQWARALYWASALRFIWSPIRRVVARAVRWGVVVNLFHRFF
jgi:hypothetical protein